MWIKNVDNISWWKYFPGQYFKWVLIFDSRALFVKYVKCILFNMYIKYTFKSGYFNCGNVDIFLWIFSTHNCLFWLIKNHVKHSKFTKNSLKIHSKSPKNNQNMEFLVRKSNLTQNGNKNDLKRHEK